MKKLLILIVFVLGFASPAYSKTTKISAKNIHEILPIIDDKTLVVFDLDNTIWKYKDYIGSAEWFETEVSEWQSEGLSRSDSVDKVYPHWLSLQSSDKIEYVNSEFPTVLKKIKEKTGFVLSLTARHSKDTEKLTFDNINKLKLNFGPDPLNGRKYFFKVEYPAKFFKNIIFAGKNDKGKLLEKALLLIADKKSYNKIVFVDDLKHNIDNMVRSFKDKDSPDLVAIHYTEHSR